MRSRFSLLALLLPFFCTAQLVLKQGSISLLSSIGTTSHSTSFTSTSPSPLPPTPIQLGEVLKLSFTVLDGDEGIQPHQAMVLFEPVDAEERKEAGRDYSAVVRVRKGGKGKWELDFSRAPPRLLSLSSGPLTATLLLGAFSHPIALRIPLGTFTLSPSLVLPFPFPADDTLPVGWEVERFKKMPEISWTVREKEKTVGAPVAVAGLLFVLSPWVVLVSIVGHLKPSLASPTLNIVSFLGCIIAFESLVVAYWTSLKLIPTLPYFGLLAVLMAFTGRKALGDVRTRRLAREGKAKKSE